MAEGIVGMLGRRGLLVGAAALGAAPLAFADDSKVAVMRFAMKGRQPVTTVFVGGKGPYISLIDTGDGVGCILRQDIIDKLGLRQVGAGRIYGATGTDTSFSYLAHDVVFGQAIREADVAFIGIDRISGGIDGVLPMSIFTARPTDMDFTTGELRVQLSGAVDRAGFRPIRSEHVSRSEAFVIQAMIDGVPARLAVDTGAATTVALYPNYVRAHGLWTKFPRHQDYQFGGVTSRIGRARLVRTPMVQIGAYKFKDPIISLADPSQTVASDIDGLLGIEMLRRFTVGFDRNASTLWLKPNGALTDPYGYDHSGLTWEWKDGAIVRSVAPGSPAETAGLKAGDRILGLDTEKAANDWDGRLWGDADTEIPVEVEQGGTRKKAKLVLKDWL